MYLCSVFQKQTYAVIGLDLTHLCEKIEFYCAKYKIFFVSLQFGFFVPIWRKVLLVCI